MGQHERHTLETDGVSIKTNPKMAGPCLSNPGDDKIAMTSNYRSIALAPSPINAPRLRPIKKPRTKSRSKISLKSLFSVRTTPQFGHSIFMQLILPGVGGLRRAVTGCSIANVRRQ